MKFYFHDKYPGLTLFAAYWQIIVNPQNRWSLWSDPVCWCPTLVSGIVRCVFSHSLGGQEGPGTNITIFYVCNKNIEKPCAVLYANKRDINMNVDNKFLKIELSEISLQALDMQIAISNCYDKWYLVSTLYKCQQLTAHIICFCHFQSWLCPTCFENMSFFWRIFRKDL